MAFRQYEQWQKILPPDENLGFGWKVALSKDGTTLIVGCSDQQFLTAGRAFVYIVENDVWVVEQELLADDLQPGAAFGVDVDLSSDGNIAVVGAPYLAFEAEDSFGTQAAYVFEREAGVWTQVQKLVGTNQGYISFSENGGDDFGEYNSTRFGSSVAISGDGDTILVSDRNLSAERDIGEDFIYTIEPPFPCTAVINTMQQTFFGAIYRFTRSGSTWNEQENIQPDDGNHTGGFSPAIGLGSDINEDGSVIIFGGRTDAPEAPTQYTWTNQCGDSYPRIRHYVYGEDPEAGQGAFWYGSNGGTLTKVTPTEFAFRQFGSDVSISGDGETMVASGSSSGWIYSYYDGGENKIDFTYPEDPSENFGPNFLWVHDISPDGNWICAGSVLGFFIFSRVSPTGNTWNQDGDIYYPDNTVGSLPTPMAVQDGCCFGMDDGSILAVGDPNDEEVYGEMNSLGAVYIWRSQKNAINFDTVKIPLGSG